VTYARPVTDELYAQLEEDLEALKAQGNPWAGSWLQILDTVAVDSRPAILAALISGLPALHHQMLDLGAAALKVLAFDVTFGFGALDPLEDVYVPPKPSSVPDHLGALFAPLADHPIAGPEHAPAISDEDAAELKADGPIAEVEEHFDKAEVELRRVRDNLRRRLDEDAGVGSDTTSGGEAPRSSTTAPKVGLGPLGPHDPKRLPWERLTRLINANPPDSSPHRLDDVVEVLTELEVLMLATRLWPLGEVSPLDAAAAKHGLKGWRGEEGVDQMSSADLRAFLKRSLMVAGDLFTDSRIGIQLSRETTEEDDHAIR